MADSRLRELERRSRAGDVEATTALFHAKTALGQSTTGHHVHLDGGPSSSSVNWHKGACGALWIEYRDDKAVDALVLTAEVGLVTCGACQRTRAFRGLAPKVLGKMHLRSFELGHRWSKCGRFIYSKLLTDDPELVTCRNCGGV